MADGTTTNNDDIGNKVRPQTTATATATSAADTVTTTTTTTTTKMSNNKSGGGPSLRARVISGSAGSVVTALAVTPLDVVKVRFQTQSATTTTTTTTTTTSIKSSRNPTTTKLPANVSLCPRGCGTFILNNGLSECVLPKSCVPYFDHQTGKLKDFNNNGGNILRANQQKRRSVSRATSTAISNELGTFAMLRRIFVTEGFQGIYAGLSPTLVMSVPNTVLYFTAYDEIVSRLRQKATGTTITTTAQPTNNNNHINNSQGRDTYYSINPQLYSLIPLVSGASARLLATLVTAPMELIRTRQASFLGTHNNSASPPTLLQELKTIIKYEGGFLALYKGLRPTLLRDVPFSSIYWFSLEQFKQQWKIRAQNQGSTSTTTTPLQEAGQAFINGAVAGMIAAACTTPFDVVKTRQQMVVTQNQGVVETANTATMQIAEAAAAAPVPCNHNGATAVACQIKTPPPPSSSGTTSLGTTSIMRNIVETEGISGLWRGNQARMIKVAPACAIMISCYELGKQVLD